VQVEGRVGVVGHVGGGFVGDAGTGGFVRGDIGVRDGFVGDEGGGGGGLRRGRGLSPPRLSVGKVVGGLGKLRN